MRGLMWFKKDLRLYDNPALSQACEQCQEGVVAIYIIDTQMWNDNDAAYCQIEFILRGLKNLSESLKKMGIPLLVETAQKTSDIPDILLNSMQRLKLQKLFFNKELEFNENRRDERVEKLLAQHALTSQGCADQFILSGETIQNKLGDYFKVFTAFKREWLKVFSQKNIRLLPIPKLKNKIILASSSVPLHLSGISSSVDPVLWPAGEAVAKKKLASFLKNNVTQYDKQRDFPLLAGTSQLSPYLAVGMISPRECFLSALEANACELDTGNKGALIWMSELIWRDFYRSILLAAPRVCKNEAYKIETEQLSWGYDEALLLAWQQGQTGFPLVDAGMRQLNSTGWMHNRLRMVVAMFLSKNLFLDWRLGEKYFAKNLMDFDFASNNGGWQWGASTGTDSVPYFRVFNPTRQSERFDPQGEFIQKFCPELRELDAYAIHDPYGRMPILAQKSHYPRPMIDYAASRQKVILAFKSLR